MQLLWEVKTPSKLRKRSKPHKIKPQFTVHNILLLLQFKYEKDSSLFIIIWDYILNWILVRKHFLELYSSDVLLKSYYVVCDHPAIHNKRLSGRQAFFFIVSHKWGTVLTATLCFLLKHCMLLSVPCYHPTPPSLSTMIIFPFVLFHCTLFLHSSFSFMVLLCFISLCFSFFSQPR